MLNSSQAKMKCTEALKSSRWKPMAFEERHWTMKGGSEGGRSIQGEKDDKCLEHIHQPAFAA